MNEQARETERERETKRERERARKREREKERERERERERDPGAGLQRGQLYPRNSAVCCSVLQCVAVCCSTHQICWALLLYLLGSVAVCIWLFCG